MLADRYVKGVLSVIALALVAIAAHLWRAVPPKTPAVRRPHARPAGAEAPRPAPADPTEIPALTTTRGIP